jgi:TRAP-type C4-dicarboxylate transport system permease small subunit
MKLSTKVNSIFDRTIDLLAFLAAIMIIFTMLLVSAEVVMRYFLRRPIAWDVEITEYLLLYITFLAAAWVLKREGHVRIDILLNRLTPRSQAMLGIITSILGILICGALVWYGTLVTWDHFLRQVTYARSLLEVPYYPILAIIPVGSLLLMLQFVRRTLDTWRGSFHKGQGA